MAKEEKIYEIELTAEELEIISVLLIPSNFYNVVSEYCYREHKSYIKYLNIFTKLHNRIKDIVNTNKHQNV